MSSHCTFLGHGHRRTILKMGSIFHFCKVIFFFFGCVLWAARDEAREERTKTAPKIDSIHSWVTAKVCRRNILISFYSPKNNSSARGLNEGLLLLRTAMGAGGQQKETTRQMRSVFQLGNPIAFTISILLSNDYFSFCVAVNYIRRLGSKEDVHLVAMLGLDNSPQNQMGIPV